VKNYIISLNHLLKYKLFEAGRPALKPYNIFHFIDKDDLDTIKKIFDRYNVNLKNFTETYDSYNPFQYSISYGHYKIAEYFLEKGANPNDKLGTAKTPILFIAAEAGNLEFVKTLIKYGADVNAKNIDNYNGLFYCCVRMSGGVNSYGIYDIDVLKFFLDKNLNPNQKSKNDYTPLRQYIHLRRLDLIEELLKRGADPNEINKKGQSVLFFTIEQGYPDIAEILIKYGADVTYKQHIVDDVYQDIIDICHTNNTRHWLDKYETQKMLAEKDPALLLKIETHFSYMNPIDKPYIDSEIKKEYPHLFVGLDLNLL
jgi:ankyrin repeat protein